MMQLISIAGLIIVLSIVAFALLMNLYNPNS